MHFEKTEWRRLLLEVCGYSALAKAADPATRRARYIASGVGQWMRRPGMG